MAKTSKPVDKPKKKIGRPISYTKELGESICNKVATCTHSLKKICADNDNFPHHETVNEWRWKIEEFGSAYARAKQAQMDLLAEEIVEISDDDSKDTATDKDGRESFNNEFAARSRLRIDSRKWLAAKLYPRVYGERNKEEQEAKANTLIEKLLEKL